MRDVTLYVSQIIISSILDTLIKFAI